MEAGKRNKTVTPAILDSQQLPHADLATAEQFAAAAETVAMPHRATVVITPETTGLPAASEVLDILKNTQNIHATLMLLGVYPFAALAKTKETALPRAGVIYQAR